MPVLKFQIVLPAIKVKTWTSVFARFTTDVYSLEKFEKQDWISVYVNWNEYDKDRSAFAHNEICGTATCSSFKPSTSGVSHRALHSVIIVS